MAASNTASSPLPSAFTSAPLCFIRIAACGFSVLLLPWLMDTRPHSSSPVVPASCATSASGRMPAMRSIGRASSAMEREAVAGIARMFGWETHLGHLTSGGTIANLEALWIAGEQNPGTTVLASSQAHYTHGRISAVLKLPFESVPVDRFARMDLDALERRLAAGGVGTVVATLGTTATGSVDPLPEILALRDRYGFRLHADCAYGGYYLLAGDLSPPARAAFDRLAEVDSIVIDPHKHGLQPYGCGCVLFRDPAVGSHYRHDSPYTYFSSKELHLGEISLECSRPNVVRRLALAAVAGSASSRATSSARDNAWRSRGSIVSPGRRAA